MARMLIIAVAGVAITGLAVTGWRALSSPPPPPPAVQAPPPVQPAMVSILVADRDVPPGSFLRPSDISSTSMTASIVPAGAWKDSTAARSALVGALVRRPIPHDTAFAPNELLLAGDHGFLATLLAPGARAFTIRHDQIVSGSELIWPGDRVDLILTEQMPDSEPLGHRVSGETVLADLRILAIDRQLIRPQPDEATSHGDAGNGAATAEAVTVEVSPTDAERLAVALRLGNVALAVRSATSSMEHGAGEGVTAPAEPSHPTWANAVMRSLDQVPSASIHVFDGTGEQEYKF